MCPEGAFKPNAAVPKQYPGGVVKSMAASDPEKLAGGFASYLALGGDRCNPKESCHQVVLPA